MTIEEAKEILKKAEETDYSVRGFAQRLEQSMGLKSGDLHTQEFTRMLAEIILKGFSFNKLSEDIVNYIRVHKKHTDESTEQFIKERIEMEKIIAELKENPQIQAAILEAANIQAEINEDSNLEREKIFETALGLTSIIDKRYKNEIATALEKYPDETPTLLDDADILWDIILAALMLEPPADFIRKLAEKLGVAAEKLAQIGKEAYEINQEEYLQGFEPTPTEQIARATNIIKQGRIAYELINKRGTSKLDRKAGFVVNTKENETVFALDIREADPIEKSKDIVRLRWNAPYNEKGEQLRVTPFDQEVETVISNFFDEGHPSITTEQIYYAMNGQTGKDGSPSKKFLQTIEQSIKKLNTIPVSIRRIENGKSYEDGNGEIITDGGNETIIAEYSTILDTTKSDYIMIQGKRRLAWRSSRQGHLYNTEKTLGRLITTRQETLNLLASGISCTELSTTLRRFCLMEIARFRTTGNYRIKDNKFDLNSMYVYEAHPVLVEITPNMERRLRTGKDKKEQSLIRAMKQQRRELLQRILYHFKKTGEIKNWDFCHGTKILPYTEDKYETKGVKIRTYHGQVDSVYIQVEKTPNAIKYISTIERRIELGERNRRRAKKEDQQQ